MLKDNSFKNILSPKFGAADLALTAQNLFPAENVFAKRALGSSMGQLCVVPASSWI